jgi:hypothetical protein
MTAGVSQLAEDIANEMERLAGAFEHERQLRIKEEGVSLAQALAQTTINPA